jgi:hypothetical protein
VVGSDGSTRNGNKEESCVTQPVSQRTLSNLLNAQGSCYHSLLIGFLSPIFASIEDQVFLPEKRSMLVALIFHVAAMANIL